MALPRGRAGHEVHMRRVDGYAGFVETEALIVRFAGLKTAMFSWGLVPCDLLPPFRSDLALGYLTVKVLVIGAYIQTAKLAFLDKGL
mmetsp:Transcript_65883/g.132313  ORF Transcript_65883/g.132313 Transcript_65883/m.132313 type:complete len:87 (+) Transcript_65883:135-395(+)